MVYVITATTLAVTLPHVGCFPMQHVPLEPAVTSQLARYEMNKPYSSFFSAPPEKKSKRKNSRIKTFKGKGKELKEQTPLSGMFVENDLKMEKNDKFYLKNCPKNQETFLIISSRSSQSSIITIIFSQKNQEKLTDLSRNSSQKP